MSGLNNMPGVALETLAVVATATASVAVQVTSTSLLCSAIYIEADAGNTAALNVGDLNVSGTRFMTSLLPVASGTNPGTLTKSIWIMAPYPERPGATNLQLSSIWIWSTATAQKAHVSYLERMGG